LDGDRSMSAGADWLVVAPGGVGMLEVRSSDVGVCAMVGDHIREERV
jgi:hypothetical protein